MEEEITNFYTILINSLKGKKIRITYEEEYYPVPSKVFSIEGIVDTILECDNGRLDVIFKNTSKNIYNLHLNTKIKIL